MLQMLLYLFLGLLCTDPLYHVIWDSKPVHVNNEPSEYDIPVPANMTYVTIPFKAKQSNMYLSVKLWSLKPISAKLLSMDKTVEKCIDAYHCHLGGAMATNQKYILAVTSDHDTDIHMEIAITHWSWRAIIIVAFLPILYFGVHGLFFHWINRESH